MGKAHVDPFLISSAALSAWGPFRPCEQVEGRAALAPRSSSPFRASNSTSACTARFTFFDFLETVDLCKTN